MGQDVGARAKSVSNLPVEPRFDVGRHALLSTLKNDNSDSASFFKLAFSNVVDMSLCIVKFKWLVTIFFGPYDQTPGRVMLKVVFEF